MPTPVRKLTESKKKLLVFLLGAGATGKTTTRKLLVKHWMHYGISGQRGCTATYTRKRNPNKGAIVTEPYVLTTYGDGDVPNRQIVLVGNDSAGTDSIVAPEIIMDGITKALKQSNVVVVDGVMSSPRWVDVTNSNYQEYKDRGIAVETLLVHFDFVLDEVLKRLLQRRAGRGKVEDTLPPKTVENARQFIGKTNRAVNHFKNGCKAPMHWERIVYGLTPEVVTAQIYKRILEIRSSNA